MRTDIAPITQLMLTVQFAPPREQLGPLEIADCFSVFREGFPKFEQISRAGPMQVEPNVMEIALPFGAARTKLTSTDGTQTIMFQEDRFSYGWDRTSPLGGPSGYPGFQEVLAEALKIWSRLRGCLLSEDAAHSALLAGEIVYVDAFRNQNADGDPVRLSSMFNLLNPEYRFPISGYDFTWNERVSDPIGFLQMQIAGPLMSPEGVVSRFETTGRFKLQGGWDGLADEFFKVHDAIDLAFKKLVNSSHRPN